MKLAGDDDGVEGQGLAPVDVLHSTVFKHEVGSDTEHNGDVDRQEAAEQQLWCNSNGEERRLISIVREGCIL